MERARNDRSFAVLGGVLGLGIVLAFALFLLVAQLPEERGELHVVGPIPVDCPDGSHTPVCYGAQVENVGSAPAPIRCEVQGGPGTTATFGNDLAQYVSAAPIDAGSQITLTIRVEPQETTGAVTTAPELGCSILE